jgi:hypothetical protein
MFIYTNQFSLTMIKKQLASLLFIISFQLLHAGGAKPIVVKPDHTIADKSMTTYYVITYHPVQEGFLDYNSKSRQVKLPKGKGTCGFGRQFCFELEYYGFSGQMPPPPPIYFSDLNGKSMCAYVDANRNLDYTDDGEPVYADANGMINLRLVDYYDKTVFIDCVYEIFSPEMVARNSTWLSENFDSQNKDKKRLDMEYWIFCRPKRIRAQNIVIGQDSMCVTLIDKDCNGKYDTDDNIALLPYGIDSAVSIEGYGAHKIKEDLILGFKGKAYEVIPDLNKPGIIKLKPRPELAPPPEVIVGQPLPHFNITLVNGKSVDIHSLLIPGKATFINFWSPSVSFSNEITNCQQQLLKTKSDSINVISISADADLPTTKKYISENNMDGTQCMADEVVINLLYRNGQTPFGILLDKNGNVYTLNVSCQDLSFYLPLLYKMK